MAPRSEADQARAASGSAPPHVESGASNPGQRTEQGGFPSITTFAADPLNAVPDDADHRQGLEEPKGNGGVVSHDDATISGTQMVPMPEEEMLAPAGPHWLQLLPGESLS